MTTCITERQLIELATGDGDAAARTHAVACAACAARLAALERDLSLLRHALRGAPAPIAVRRLPWVPVVAAAAIGVTLLLLTVIPARLAAPSVAAGSVPTAEFSAALANAIFADASLDLTEAYADDRALAAALNGGAVCAGGYGDDCTGALLLADYD